MLKDVYIIYGSDPVTIDYALRRLARYHNGITHVDNIDSYINLVRQSSVIDPDLVVISNWEKWTAANWKIIKKQQAPFRRVFISRKDKLAAKHPIRQLESDLLHYPAPKTDKDWLVWIEQQAKRLGVKAPSRILLNQIGPNPYALWSELEKIRASQEIFPILPLRAFDAQGAAYHTYQAWTSDKPEQMFQFMRGQHPTTYWEYLQKEFLRQAIKNPSPSHNEALAALAGFSGWVDLSWLDAQLGLRHALIQLYSSAAKSSISSSRSPQPRH